MTIKGYTVRSKDYQWIRPYLFRSEATEIAELMTVANGTLHWIVETEMENLSNALVRFNGKELIVDLWSISVVGSGFEANALIEGQLYRVQLRCPFEPWDLVQAHKKASDLDHSEQYSISSEPDPAELIRATTQTNARANDEVACYNPTSIPKSAN